MRDPSTIPTYQLADEARATPAATQPHPDTGDAAAATEMPTPTLGSLERGATAVVSRWLVSDRALADKLSARGIVPGATIRVLQQGDPVMLKVEDTRWAISAADARQVVVERAAPTPERRARTGILARLLRR